MAFLHLWQKFFLKKYRNSGYDGAFKTLAYFAYCQKWIG